MQEFYQLKSLNQLQELLTLYQKKTINLLDIHQQSDRSYFANLLMSPLTRLVEPTDLLQAIVDKGSVIR